MEMEVEFSVVFLVTISKPFEKLPVKDPILKWSLLGFQFHFLTGF